MNPPRTRKKKAHKLYHEVGRRWNFPTPNLHARMYVISLPIHTTTTIRLSLVINYIFISFDRFVLFFFSSRFLPSRTRESSRQNFNATKFSNFPAIRQPPGTRSDNLVGKVASYKYLTFYNPTRSHPASMHTQRKLYVPHTRTRTQGRH